MRYRGKKPRHNSTVAGVLMCVAFLLIAILFCTGFVSELIRWGCCV